MAAYFGEWRLRPHGPVTPAHVAHARKLVGSMLEIGGIPKRTQRTGDGATITAHIANGMPQVTIDVPTPTSVQDECMGLAGSVSDPAEVQSWPAVIQGFYPENGYGLETTWFIGAHAGHVYLLRRAPPPANPTAFRFDSAANTVETYGSNVTAPRDLLQPPIVYRDAKVSAGPLMTSPPFTHTTKDGRDDYQFPVVDLQTGQAYKWLLTLPASPHNRSIEINRPPTVFNLKKKGWAQSNIAPLSINETDGGTGVNQYVTLFDYKLRKFPNPRSVFDPSLPYGAAIIGVKKRTIYALGYADANGPTDDMYVVDFDSGRSEHRHLPVVPKRPSAYAQVCDMLLMVGGADSDTHFSGDVWLYKLGAWMRKIGHIPELEDTVEAGASSNALNGTYLAVTPNKVYVFTPVCADSAYPGVVTKYNVRTIS